MKTSTPTAWFHKVLCGLSLVAALGSTGCQLTEGGQTLPSPYYIEDDVQFFPAGPEFILTEEAAALEKFRADEALRRANRQP